MTGVLSEGPPVGIDVPRNLAIGLVVVAVAGGINSHRWLVRCTTVDVPGDPWYLRNLGRPFVAPW